LFRLCQQLGVIHPRRLSVEPEELYDWWLYFNCDPWGDIRDDYRAFFASHGSMSDEVKPTWPYVDEPISAEEIAAAIKAE
jgi:hypothetical protein